ncbi:MAG: OmpH family outer membrane protein [Bryobacterales bacterium]|nr:OmpH family outer membrane protein [Bryobacterales bacterium]
MKRFVPIAALAAILSAPAPAQQAPTKIAVINIQAALIGTADGKKAAADLQARFDPKRKILEGKQGEIAQLQQELNKGSNTMAEARRLDLTRQIDSKTKALQRDQQDAQEEFELEQNKVLNELGQRMMVVIDKYAKDNQYAVVIDISSQQTPVLWAANGINITDNIIALYDKNAPPPASGGGAAAAPAAPAAPPAAPPKKAPGAVKK